MFVYPTLMLFSFIYFSYFCFPFISKHVLPNKSTKKCGVWYLVGGDCTGWQDALGTERKRKNLASCSSLKFCHVYLHAQLHTSDCVIFLWSASGHNRFKAFIAFVFTKTSLKSALLKRFTICFCFLFFFSGFYLHQNYMAICFSIYICMCVWYM